MTQLSPQMDAALRGVAPLIFGAVSIELPGRQINLIDGAGTVTFGGKTYVGRDPTYGTLASIENLADGMGDSAPALSITLLPASDAAAAELAGPLMQGAPVTIHLGAIDRLSGLVIPDPTLLFLGELDVPTLRSTATGRALDYEVVSAFERLFTDDERARLSPGFHRAIWPGEAGLDFVTGVQETVYWGVAGVNGAVVHQTNGGMAAGWQGAMP